MCPDQSRSLHTRTHTHTPAHSGNLLAHRNLTIDIRYILKRGSKIWQILEHMTSSDALIVRKRLIPKRPVFGREAGLWKYDLQIPYQEDGRIHAAAPGLCVFRAPPKGNAGRATGEPSAGRLKREQHTAKPLQHPGHWYFSCRCRAETTHAAESLLVMTLLINSTITTYLSGAHLQHLQTHYHTLDNAIMCHTCDMTHFDRQ